MENLHLYIFFASKMKIMTLKEEASVSNHAAKTGRRFKFMLIFCHEYFALLLKLALQCREQKHVLKALVKELSSFD